MVREISSVESSAFTNVEGTPTASMQVESVDPIVGASPSMAVKTQRVTQEISKPNIGGRLTRWKIRFVTD